MGFANRAESRKFPAMAFFKRPEVWVLLLLSVVGSAWVLWSDLAHDRARSEDRGDEVAATEEAAPGRFLLRDLRVAREEAYLIVTLEVGTRETVTLPGPLDLAAPTARLVAADGTEVPPFFLPFAPPAVLDPEPGASAQLRYWLPVTQVGNALWLEIDGERLAVKDPVPPAESGAFVERFPEGLEVAVNGLDWQP